MLAEDFLKKNPIQRNNCTTVNVEEKYSFSHLSSNPERDYFGFDKLIDFNSIPTSLGLFYS